MKKKYLPILFILLGFAGTLLPFHSVSVSGQGASADDALAVKALEQFVNQEGLQNAWNYEQASAHPGVGMSVLLGLLGLGCVALAIWGLRRGASIATFIVGLLAATMDVLIVRGDVLVRSTDSGGVTLDQTPGIGFYLMVAAVLGVLAISFMGIVKPERRTAS